jgi:nicotinamidase-related amidase
MHPNEAPRKNIKSRAALLIIDMLNTFDFPQGFQLAQKSLSIAKRIARLKVSLKKKGIPCIYVNDNFGQWQSDWKKVFESCSAENSRGHKVAKIIRPEEDDYFVLKPRHSGFYCTNLELLLEDLGVEELIVTGVAGNICVLFTVNDAHMRDYKVWVPSDCVVSNTQKENSFALKQMKTVLQVKTSQSSNWTNNI